MKKERGTEMKMYWRKYKKVYNLHYVHYCLTICFDILTYKTVTIEGFILNLSEKFENNVEEDKFFPTIGSVRCQIKNYQTKNYNFEI